MMGTLAGIWSSGPVWTVGNWWMMGVQPRAFVAIAYQAPPVAKAEPAPEPKATGWHLCLACDAPLDPVRHSRRTGLCPSCHRTNDHERLAFYAMAMSFWRKMHRTGFRTSMFKGAPSPWQVTLLRLAQLLLGFQSTLASIGTRREGADVRLQTPADDLKAMTLGTLAVSPSVRQRLAEIGHQWFKDLRDMERDDDDESFTRDADDYDDEDDA